MKSVQSAEFRKHLSGELQAISEDRQPVEILRHGQPVAVLSPAVGTPPGRRKPILDLDAIAGFCKKHSLRQFCLFGSVLRDDFDEDSDVDVMADSGTRSVTLSELCDMMDELEAMFGRRTDLVFKKDVEALDKKYRTRDEILATASEVYHEAA
jgi:hypothetical protein